MMGLENPVHLLFLLLVVLLVFGAKRLPEMGRSLGSGMRGFKESLSAESSHAGELGRAPQSTPGAVEHAQSATTAGELRG